VSGETGVPLATVCRILSAPRSTIYARGTDRSTPAKRGPRTDMADEELLELIRQVIAGSPFAGEGHRKVTARLGSTGSVLAASAYFD